MSSEDTYYEERATWHPSRFSARDQQARFRQAASLVPKDSQSILDVGCGNGAFLEHIEKHRKIAPPVMRGLERSRTAREASVCHSPIDTGSIDSLPYDDGSFDLVAALEVIEHLPQPIYVRSLSELARVARHFVLISVPYRERRKQVACPVCSCRFHPSYHMRSFNDSVLKVLLPGFALERVITIEIDDYLGAGILRPVYRFLANGDDMPGGSLCPQCGFRQPHVRAVPPLLGARMALRRRFRASLPKRRRRNWYIARYVRTTTLKP